MTMVLKNFKTRFCPLGTYELSRAGHYSDGSWALRLYSSEDGSAALTVTVAVEGTDIPDGHILIKDWSENEGVREALLKAGVIENVAVLIPTGFVYAYLCKLTETARQKLGV